MLSFKDLEENFGTKNLYEVLGVERDVDEDALKRAYRKTSLKVHPDRAKEEDKEKATKRFQVLAKVYQVLSNKDSRTVYDNHGLICNDHDNFESEAEWLNYWRLLFPEISVKDVDHFMEDYIGSEEEEKDLIEIYNRFEGDMNMINEYHIGFEEARVTKLLKKLIKDGKIKDFPKFSGESEASKEKRTKRTAKEAKQAAKAKDKMKSKKEDSSNMDDLAALIKSKRSANFDSMIARLETKYANTDKGVKRNWRDRNQ